MDGVCRLPLYYEAKLVFVVFLWHPSTQGSMIVYDKYVRPLLASNEVRALSLSRPHQAARG